MSKRTSIITRYDKICIICGSNITECHHLLGGTNKRKIADEDGVFCGVCPKHHNSSNMSVHQNKEMKVLSQQVGQLSWEKFELIKQLSELTGKSTDELFDEVREKFRKRYGQSYL